MTSFPKAITRLPASLIHILALPVSFMAAALIYEPKALGVLMGSGSGFTQIDHLHSFNIVICFAIILVVVAIFRMTLWLTRKHFPADLWSAAREEAQDCVIRDTAFRAFASDIDPECVRIARESAERGSYRDEPEKVRRLYAVLTWMCALAAFLGCICALVTDTLPMRLMMLALAFILFAVTGALSYLRPGRGETASPDKEPEEREDPDLLRTRLLGEEISKTSRQAAALREELNGLYDQSAAGNRHASEREAIDLALERIRSLSDQICLEAGDDFDENASFILSALTGQVPLF